MRCQLLFFFDEVMLEQLESAYKNAMKNKDEPRKTILNYVLAQIKNKRIELQRAVSDEEVVQILRKEVKALNEALSYLKQAGKDQDYIIENQKKMILEQYLPQMFDLEQTRGLVHKAIEVLNITDFKRERGILIKALLSDYQGRVDMALVNQIISEMI